MARKGIVVKEAPSCDWREPNDSRPPKAAQLSRVYRHKGGCSWTGVKTSRYKQTDGGWSSIVRTVLVGECGETAKFHLRYFEIEPGGYSSHEHHRHEHVVICVRGEGTVRIGKRAHRLRYLDTVYVAPDEAHQLSNPTAEPFGFLCIVNARRDRPKILKHGRSKK